MIGDGLLDLARGVGGDGHTMSRGGDHRHCLRLSNRHGGLDVSGDERRLDCYDIGAEVADDLAQAPVKPVSRSGEVRLARRGEGFRQRESIFLAVGIDGANAHPIGSGVYAEYEQLRMLRDGLSTKDTKGH